MWACVHLYAVSLTTYCACMCFFTQVHFSKCDRLISVHVFVSIIYLRIVLIVFVCVGVCVCVCVCV